MNNFEFQKMMNAKPEEKEENLEEQSTNNIIEHDEFSLDDKIADHPLTIEEINQKRMFNNQLNNISNQNQNH